MKVIKRYCIDCACFKSVFKVDEWDTPLCPECYKPLVNRVLDLGVENDV